MSITALIVDDHEIVRMGLMRLIEEIQGVSVVAQASDGETAVRLASELKPDVILMDIQMPGIGGLEATRRILRQRSEQKIIILTAQADGPLPKALINLGARGFLSKNGSITELSKAIHDVANGMRYLAPDVAQRLALQLVADEEGSPFDALTERELQVVLMMMQGYSGTGIGDALHISAKTVSTYRTRVYDKLNIGNSVELTRLAMQYGLADVPTSKPM